LCRGAEAQRPEIDLTAGAGLCALVALIAWLLGRAGFRLARIRPGAWPGSPRLPRTCLSLAAYHASRYISFVLKLVTTMSGRSRKTSRDSRPFEPRPPRRGARAAEKAPGPGPVPGNRFGPAVAGPSHRASRPRRQSGNQGKTSPANAEARVRLTSHGEKGYTVDNTTVDAWWPTLCFLPGQGTGQHSGTPDRGRDHPKPARGTGPGVGDLEPYPAPPGAGPLCPAVILNPRLLLAWSAGP